MSQLWLDLKGPSEILRLLPAWMREDRPNRALAAGTDAVTRALYGRTKPLSRWDKLDQLPEKELDELAWELNIKWYDSTAPIEAKRNVVRNSDLVYAKLGSKFAVDQVIRDYYGTGRSEEWINYGGKPHRFRVYIEGHHVDLDGLMRFRRILEIVKRRSSWLDEIIIIAPATHCHLPLTPIPGPRYSRVELPPVRRTPPAGRISATPVRGITFSVTVLPMAAGREGGEHNGL